MSTAGKKFSETPSLSAPPQMLGLSSDGSVGRLPMSKLMMHKGSVSDLNEAWGQIGLYHPTTDCLNYPSGVTPNPSDAILCLSETEYGVQMLFAMNSRNGIYMRIRTGSSYNGWFYPIMTS